MKCPLIPLQGKCVVRRHDPEEKSIGGILLPENAQQESRKGIVLSVGMPKQADDGRELPCQLREGQTVYFARYAGNEIEIEREKFLLLDFSDILAVFKG